MPWGILIGGEELHNNHHAYVTSARLSSRWYEFDIGWLYIRVLQTLGLARVKRVAPTLKVDTAKSQCDLATLHVLVTHRYEVLAQYGRSLRRTCVLEMRSLKSHAVDVDAHALMRWLHVDTSALPHNEHGQREQVIKASTVLATVYTMRDELVALWQRSNASRELLVRELEDWCRRAEASGIEGLQAFSKRLRSYRSSALSV